MAIDGPGASGKNTVGMLLSQHFGHRFLDTGAMYRALTWLALQRGIPFDDAPALVGLAQATLLSVTAPDTGAPYGRLYADGADLTVVLHRPEVDAKVSLLARIPGVRRVMVEQQRRMASEDRIVMVGRDIGTVVLPNADLKVYLNAAPEVRARRRVQDIGRSGDTVDYETVLAELRVRDRLDESREDSPLRPAADAHNIQTEHLDPQAVVEAILNLWQTTP